jgi:hypothetical protein
MPKLIDKFGREITYLRLSVTEHCNYRCFYCRDDEHVPNCKRCALVDKGISLIPLTQLMSLAIFTMPLRSKGSPPVNRTLVTPNSAKI